MYTLIFLVAHERQKMLRNGALGQPSNNLNQQCALLRDLKVIRMLLFVVGVFIFCWGPLFICLLMYYYIEQMIYFCSHGIAMNIPAKTSHI
jgi:hypothetical protein